MSPPKKNILNGAEALVRSLQAHGVQHIFGLCGDTSLPYYDALYRLDHPITHILTRDERSAAYMADAYARVTGRVGVCEGPSGGGATYILPGLIEAKESSYPVLAITSDISVASYGKYPLTAVDQEALMRPLTKWNTTIVRADHIPRMVREAFRNMTTACAGSAHLGLPYDIQYDPVDVEDIWADERLARYPAYRVSPEPGSVQRAHEALQSAKRPLVVCGGGIVIADAMAELQKIAQTLDLAVATSISGKGSLSDFDPQCLGVVGSNGGTDQTWKPLQDADLVIFMGIRAGSTTTSRWEAPVVGTRIIHFDSDPLVIGANYPTEVAVVGDLRLALQEWNAILQDSTAKTFGGKEIVREAKARKFALFQERARDEQSPLRPETIIDALNRLLPRGATVVSDPGTSCPYIAAYWQQPEPGRYYITNRAHGALGYSLSAAFGAWCGRTQSKIVGIMGDGSFGFTCGELETAARYQAPITYIVLSNASFGWIKASQKDDTEARYYNVDFSKMQHAEIARAMGVKSWSVNTREELENALTEALACDEGPSLIDIHCQALEEATAPVRRWMG